uniref:DUF7153 domain-containing protein n=1 Tax=Ciona savignyi TaxID=51511 RepID=H2YVV8_CIOSA
MGSLAKSFLSNKSLLFSNLVRHVSSVATPNDRCAWFNFIDRPNDETAFRTLWMKGGNYIKQVDGFVKTHLYKAVDNDARYQWVNFTEVDREDFPFFSDTDVFWSNYIEEVMKLGYKGTPAGYKHVTSLKDNSLTDDSDGFFLSAVKVNSAQLTDDKFERNWENLTGTTFIHENLNPENLTNSHLYKQFKLLPIFNYTVRTEVINIDDKTGSDIAKAANERQLSQRMTATTGFYRLDTTLNRL